MNPENRDPSCCLKATPQPQNPRVDNFGYGTGTFAGNLEGLLYGSRYISEHNYLEMEPIIFPGSRYPPVKTPIGLTTMTPKGPAVMTEKGPAIMTPTGPILMPDKILRDLTKGTTKRTQDEPQAASTSRPATASSS
ncbi:hypothetical protein Dda_7021 [Drechslerella dactyloides]|uniref:Uncharacterized protein n=1 Tax=Drechslerella dactyloides TaxID=74499 RepID=A0AAD6IWP8_DREDA|nr:hypothetical protein Dda_7021 [Drechslerella dactyloides]